MNKYIKASAIIGGVWGLISGILIFFIGLVEGVGNPPVISLIIGFPGIVSMSFLDVLGFSPFVKFRAIFIISPIIGMLFGILVGYLYGKFKLKN